MAANNLRIIYNNLANGATITASPTALGATSIANLQSDSKSLVYRASGTTATITTTLTAASTVGAVVIPFTNLTSTATINVTLQTTAGGALTATGAVSACPYQGLGGAPWGTIPSTSNGYAYGGGTYARVWFTPVANVGRLIIVITDTANTSGFIELSRLIIGNYWSPTYNTEYGLSNSIKDLSAHQRTEAGEMISNRGIRYSGLSFNLNYMPPADRQTWYGILKNGGLTNPLLISIFPDNSADWAKERDYMVYGKLVQFSDIVHPIYNSYNTQVEIEEI